ncbi:hypothetical protein [Limnobacter litoralis]|uniref:Uncharacterized protein n=1 Tax=Limnobacter litoralis TaxID=481366 RepID=A0ABQ5YUM9_9BURK|nr:hypothetical protein [Limnobacter litoralis]GLR27171.1 hypothetical protein GCM10007875_22620 [Limnobacter litoralis]
MTLALSAPRQNSEMGFSRDIESQRLNPVATRRYNPYVTAAKIGGLGICAGAGLVATSLLASLDPTQTHHMGRSLQDTGCTDKQLENIQKAKQALLYSGIAAASGLGAAFVGGCSTAACPESGASGPFLCLAQLGGVALSLGSTAVLVSGIIYGVMKSNC